MSTYNMFINNRNISIDEMFHLFPDYNISEINKNNYYLLTDLFESEKKTKIGGSMSKAPFRICGVYKECSFSSKDELYKLSKKYDLLYDFKFENNLETYFTLFTQNQPYIVSVGTVRDLPENVKGTAKFQVLQIEQRLYLLKLAHETNISYIFDNLLIVFSSIFFLAEKNNNKEYTFI